MTEMPWLSHYDKGVPHTLKPYPSITLPGLLRKIAREHPEYPALLFMGNSISYGELERESDAFAAALLASGVRKGDRVTVLLPNSPQMIIAEFGIWKAGGIVVPLNPLYTEHEIERAIDESEAAVAIVLAPFYEKLSHLRRRGLLDMVAVSELWDYMIAESEASAPGAVQSLLSGDFAMRSMIEQYRGSAEQLVEPLPEEPALFLFSGGTTGKPKCVVGRHEASIMTGMQLNAWCSVVLGQERSVIMLNLPLSHVYAQVAVMPVAFLRSAPLALVPDPRDVEMLISTIKRFRVALLPGVPTLFSALASHPLLKKEPHALDSLKLIISAAAPLHLDTRSRFEALTGATIIEAYGLTETMVSPACMPLLGVKKPGSVGMPVPDVEVRIVDADTGEDELPSGEVGEVIIRSPQCMSGFWSEPEETEAILRDGWLYSGDLGYLDSDGYLYIVDRKKDVIKPGGFQVWPREVEEVIAAHPAVLETGVAGVPDDYQGEAVKAWVVLRNGETLDAADLKSWCRKELVAYKVPKQIEFRDSLPKSAVGKVLRRVLAGEHRTERESNDPR
ncbi:MAG TPA: AMP-dependent synthetase [Chlorobaculum parvum]|uniref:AMP-dependent synthetase n=1 Tax=Chlorobaculum parvum TaxID=274539 RepID=A0A7C5DBZ7_9CHLB|nr:AMP-dependent synthetase [Chlorobaculum parvum]